MGGIKMLISARMLEIVKHLYQYKTTTYKEIEQSLGIKERNVRYDVDRINEILAENGLEQIERKGKGVLEVPANFKTYIFETNNEFVYSQAERSSILLLYLFFNNKELKLNKIAKKIQVSRSTIKNDFDEIEQMLLKKGFEIKYDDNFIINGDTRHCIHFMVGEIKKYISLFKILYPVKESVVLRTKLGVISASVLSRVKKPLRSKNQAASFITALAFP